MNAHLRHLVVAGLAAVALLTFSAASIAAGRSGKGGGQPAAKGGDKSRGAAPGSGHAGSSSHSSVGGIRGGDHKSSGANQPGIGQQHGAGSAGKKGGKVSLGSQSTQQAPSLPSNKRAMNRPDLGLYPGGSKSRSSERPNISSQPGSQPITGNTGSPLTGNKGSKEISRPTLPDFNQRPTSRPAVRPGAGNPIVNQPGVAQPLPARPTTKPDRVRPETRPDRGTVVVGGDRTNITNIVNNNHWEHNHQTIINNSPTIINTGYRPGVSWGGNGYGYRGNWGYGRQHFHDDSWWYGPGWRPAYLGYHGRWYHGSCSSNFNWGSYAAGVLTGVATTWALGSRTYVWGYGSYYNPYYTPAVQTIVVRQYGTPVYNYLQPINTEAPPPSAEIADPTIARFDEARIMFRGGDYAQALALTDQALAKMPNDASMHEFRALVLFALNRYDEASAVLYSVLSVGPGWDWTTLAGLYDSIDTYTLQLRTLESYRRQHTDEPAPAFLLAYHYLTAGYKDEAADMYQNVVTLQPEDTLSRGLLSSLRPPAQPATPPSPMPGAPDSIDPARLVGNWRATANSETSIALALQPDGHFTWDVSQGGQTRRLQGTYTLEDNVLTLAPPEGEGGAMAGAVNPDRGGFRFRAIGAPPEDQGLAFTR